ncbi:MAG: histidine phosphatase family protein [Acidimicrobiales bacterium]|nr:histidine phosphatase family protein [Acidimicrobiales bacterium]
MPAINFLVVRHGQSEWNAAGRWQGRANPPLTTEGRRQAAAAARSLGSFDAVVASPLLRAAETATIIAEHLGIGPVLVEPALVERDAGEWQGLTRSQIETDWPGYLESGKRPPGYESDEMMLNRVSEAIDQMVDRAGAMGANGEILVVAHGGVIYALEEACGKPWQRIPNLGARWFKISDGKLSSGLRAELIPNGTLPDVL